MTTVLERAQGALLAHLAGDALGSLVEFQHAREIRSTYPDGVRHLADGGTWNTIAGQPTDDGELTLALARVLVENRGYDSSLARAAYVDWMHSGPFDIGTTTRRGLSGHPDEESQANGALMRICPLGIFGASRAPGDVATWARQDAAITHPNQVCQDANAVFSLSIARAVAEGLDPRALYDGAVEDCAALRVEPAVREAVEAAAEAPPADYSRHQGWVLIALQNAYWQLIHADSLESGVVDSVMRGGDTDTNAAICGGLLGAVYGLRDVPQQWASAVTSCRPDSSDSRVRRPRPQVYWPVDALELAQRLVEP